MNKKSLTTAEKMNEFAKGVNYPFIRDGHSVYFYPKKGCYQQSAIDYIFKVAGRAKAKHVALITDVNGKVAIKVEF